MDIDNSFILNYQNLEAIKCPSKSECINKLWGIQTTEYYSALKRNELPSHEKTWKKFKCILLSEKRYCEKTAYCMVPII